MNGEKTKLDKLKDSKDSALYIGKEEIIVKRKIKDKQDAEKLFEEINLRLQNYLKMDNVSFLFGTGSSMPLGAESIGSMPLSIEKNLLQKVNKKRKMAQMFYFTIGMLSKDKELIQNARDEVKFEDYAKRRREQIERLLEAGSGGEIKHKINLEHLLGYLYKIKSIKLNNDSSISIDNFKISGTEDTDGTLIDKLIKFLKTELFNLCNIPREDFVRKEKDENLYKKEHKENEEIEIKDYYYYHKELLKRILSRPLNLKRAKIFTTNYDLVIEKAMDELGIMYIDGFVGFHRRTLRPESYNYDLYYPTTTTEGKVHRLEKVIHFYKLHGSLSWIEKKKDSVNIYGIEERNIETLEDKEKGRVMVYPTPLKKRFALDFPYSEMFRHFASAITQPQSVLITIGYSFGDEHINDIIYQALSISSFTLIVVNKSLSSEIERLINIDDPRIIVLTGNYLGNFRNFSTEVLPYFHETKIEENIARTMNILYKKDVGEKNNEP
ncbi:hypothetical protein ES707_05635 [subsurface metagenome]